MIQLELKSFSLKEAQKNLVKKVIQTFPHYSNAKLATELGMNERTFYRYLKQNKISTKELKLDTNEMVNILKAQGYTVVKLK